jgi:hypothetical protein
MSIFWVEWDIIFQTWDDILWKEIENNDLDGREQWIKSIKIIKSNVIELSFIKNIEVDDLEFQLLETIEIDKIKSISDDNKIKILLKWKILKNSEYVWTLTYLEWTKLWKIDIEKGIYYFLSKKIKEYNKTLDDTFVLESLEDTLKNALAESKENNQYELLDSEKELQELNSAWDDPENAEQTQLEKLALAQMETPDTGAETWVLIFATFILNTFYFLSRRKKKQVSVKSCLI